MKKPFLVLSKVQKWYLANKPDEVLLAKMGDGTIPIRVIDDGVEQDVYMDVDSDSGSGKTELEVEILSDLEFKAVIVEEDGRKSYVRIFRQPEKDAWIEWREV